MIDMDTAERLGFRDRFQEFVSKWTRIGHATEPADRIRAENSVPLIYQAGGIKPPKRIAWYQSPLAMAMDRPKSRRNSFVSDCIYGQHDAGWLSLYDFMREVFGLREQTEKMVGLFELAQSAGWALPTADVCMICERPSELRLDNAGRLHSLDYPAVRYPDGWSIYAVRGVRVKREWVEGKAKLDPQLALTHPNVEERAAAAALIGWNRMLELLPHSVVDSETDPNYDFGKLLRVDLPDEPDQRFLQVLCPTGRTMVLRVPPTMTTARQANAWTQGFDRVEDFQPEGRT